MTRWLPLVLVFGGCADPELELRIAQLEAEVEQLKKRPAAPAAPAAGQAAAKNPQNDAAIALFREGNQLVSAGNYDAAKAKFNEVIANHGGTPVAGNANKALKEIEVIGKPAVPLKVEKWYQGEGQAADGTTLYVFWEVWCPHCKREVPKLEATHKTWGPKGLSVVGLTKQNRNITDEQVSSFITQNNVSYPIAKEADGAMSRAYNVSGIPAAAVVKDGKVVWRGHPGRITDDMLKSWTGS